MSNVLPLPTAAAVLDHARTLARERRFGEAIAYTTAENQRLRDPQLEYRLVQWRHDAFSDDHMTPRPDWPPAVPDVFADDGTVPEISADALDARTLAAGLLHHGCLIVRGLLSRPDATRLADGISRVFESATAVKATAGSRPGLALPWYGPFKAGDVQIAMQRAVVQKAGAAVWTADSPRMLFDLLDVFERRRVIDIIQEHLGERPVLSVEKATLRLVPPTTGTDWHQDGAFLGASIRAVNVWLALSACGVDAPGLDLLPRRIPYIVETGTHGAKFKWSVGADRVTLEAKGTPIASPVFEPGDAVVIDQLSLHRTGVRPSMTHSRWAIESWFLAPSTIPAGHHAIVL